MANLLFFLISGVTVEKPALPLIWRERVHFSPSLSSSVLLQCYYSVSRRFFKNMYLILFYVAGYSSWVYDWVLNAQNAPWCQKKALNPLDLESMQFWGYMWVLGTEPGPGQEKTVLWTWAATLVSFLDELRFPLETCFGFWNVIISVFHSFWRYLSPHFFWHCIYFILCLLCFLYSYYLPVRISLCIQSYTT